VFSARSRAAYELSARQNYELLRKRSEFLTAAIFDEIVDPEALAQELTAILKVIAIAEIRERWRSFIALRDLWVAKTPSGANCWSIHDLVSPSGMVETPRLQAKNVRRNGREATMRHGGDGLRLRWGNPDGGGQWGSRLPDDALPTPRLPGEGPFSEGEQ